MLTLQGITVREDQSTAVQPERDQLGDHPFMRLNVSSLAALRHLVERWLSDIDTTMFDQRSHVPEDKGQQQRPDVTAVDVSIRHQDDFSVSAFCHVFELGHRWNSDRLEQVGDFGVIEDLDELSLFDVQDLPA